jgi:hypothetical protein
LTAVPRAYEVTAEPRLEAGRDGDLHARRPLVESHLSLARGLAPRPARITDMSDNHLDPDLGCEIFVLSPAEDCDHAAQRGDSAP